MADGLCRAWVKDMRKLRPLRVRSREAEATAIRTAGSYGAIVNEDLVNRCIVLSVCKRICNVDALGNVAADNNVAPNVEYNSRCSCCKGSICRVAGDIALRERSESQRSLCEVGRRSVYLIKLPMLLLHGADGLCQLELLRSSKF